MAYSSILGLKLTRFLTSTKLLEKYPMHTIGQVLETAGIGLKTTARAGLLAFGGTALISGAQAAQQIRRQQVVGYAQYTGLDPALYYDAASNVDRVSGDKTLGATGELVFGLNNSRHGR